jgi:hypothetical protein
LFTFIFLLTFCSSILFLFSCSKDKEKSTEKYLSASDSISYYLRKAESLDFKKTEKVKILDKATTIIKKSENSLKNRELNFKIITKYFETGEWNHYKNAAEILLKNSISANDIISKANAYRSFGNYYYQMNQPDSSFLFYTKSENIYFQINDYDGYSTIMLKKG